VFFLPVFAKYVVLDKNEILATKKLIIKLDRLCISMIFENRELISDIIYNFEWIKIKIRNDYDFMITNDFWINSHVREEIKKSKNSWKKGPFKLK